MQDIEQGEDVAQKIQFAFVAQQWSSSSHLRSLYLEHTMMHDDRIKIKLQLKLNLQRPAAREVVDERCQLLVSSISQERIEYLSPTPQKGL